MKVEELRTKSQDELKKRVLDLRKEQMNLRFQQANNQMTNTSQLRNVRRDIARAKTISAQLENGKIAPSSAKPKKETTTKTPAKKAVATKKD